MKVFVIGSVPREAGSGTPPNSTVTADFSKAAQDLGAALATADHTIMVGSDRETTLDFHVVKGAATVQKQTTVEIHRPEDGREIFTDSSYSSGTSIKLTSILYTVASWDVVHMLAIKRADAIIIMGGGNRTLRAGIAAYLIGKPVIPIGSFRGGAREVWRFASTTRASFYRNLLTDEQIDMLASRWRPDNAKAVVGYLDRLHSGVQRERILKGVAIACTFILLVSLATWIFVMWIGTSPAGIASLTNAAEPPANSSFLLLLILVCAAGVVGASMRSVRDLRRGEHLAMQTVLLDLALGLSAAVLSVVLYLVAGVAILGQPPVLQFEDPKDFARTGMIVSTIAIFAALYIENAFDRFDSVRRDILSPEAGRPPAR